MFIDSSGPVQWFQHQRWLPQGITKLLFSETPAAGHALNEQRSSQGAHVTDS